MKYQYQTQGTCSKLIDIEVDEQGTILSVSFLGGCNGNLKGISQLVKGKKMTEIVASLEGITCGMKPTSCPDQLAQALKAIIAKQNK